MAWPGSTTQLTQRSNSIAEVPRLKKNEWELPEGHERARLVTNAQGRSRTRWSHASNKTSGNSLSRLPPSHGASLVTNANALNIKWGSGVARQSAVCSSAHPCGARMTRGPNNANNQQCTTSKIAPTTINHHQSINTRCNNQNNTTKGMQATMRKGHASNAEHRPCKQQCTVPDNL